MCNFFKRGGSGVYARIIFGVVGSFAFISFTFWFFNKIFSHLAQIEQFPIFFIYGLSEKFFSMIFLTVFSMLILSSLITAISTFFNAKELQLLYTLPLSKSRIYIKKAFETILYSSYLLILIVMPGLCAYAVNFKSGLAFIVIATVLFLFFIIGPCLMGASVTVLLVAFLPVRRVHQFLTAVIAVAFVLLVFLFRMMSPEKLINPISTTDFVFLLNSISEPASKNYPNYWLANGIISLAQHKWQDFLMQTGKIVIMNGSAVVMLSLMLILVYKRSWNRAQYTSHSRFKRSLVARMIYNRQMLQPSSRALMVKELLLFSRDPTQWSQVFLLVALVVVYIYNIKNIPVPVPSAQVIIAYINIALSGFVMAALGMRFVFPSISLEGYASWVLYASPVELKKYFRIKQILYFVILIITSQIIIWMSNYYLHVGMKLMLISSLINLEFVLAIIGLGLGLGAIYKDYTIDNPIKLASTFGGILFMILSFAAIGIIILIEAYPIYINFKAQLGFQVTLVSEWIFHAGALFFALLCYYLPQRIGIKHMQEM